MCEMTPIIAIIYVNRESQEIQAGKRFVVSWLCRCLLVYSSMQLHLYDSTFRSLSIQQAPRLLYVVALSNLPDNKVVNDLTWCSIVDKLNEKFKK